MKKHLQYLKYLIKHKWFVFKAGWVLRVPLWRLVIHDWSKFLPSEWFPYVESFYGKERTDMVKFLFDRAWLFHQNRQPHHWQYWILLRDDGSVIPTEMPLHFVREMVADWAGAGRAITGKYELSAWYDKNKEKIKLNEYTRRHVEHYIKRLEVHFGPSM